MDYDKFYAQLFKPIEERIGPIDKATIMAIVGFDYGGPVSLSTVGYGREKFTTYITCELAVREEQQPSKAGQYEIMMTCDDEEWSRKMLTKIGEMSLESVFGHGHTVDISALVKRSCPLKGLVIEEFARVVIDGCGYGILRLHGVTSAELKFAMKSGADQLLKRLEKSGVYPRTSIHRKESVVLTD